MSTTLIHRLKPSAPVRVHLFLAALIWLVVGSGLGFFGMRWVIIDGRTMLLWWLIPALVVGFLKAYFVLGKAARRMTTRIIARGDGRCLGGFLSPLTWLLVMLMMGSGMVLRSGWLELGYVGVIYAGVGVALFTASFRLWAVWWRYESANS